MSKGIVMIAAPTDPALYLGLAEAAFGVRPREKITREEALEQIGDCVGIVTANRLNIDAALIEAGKKLRWIARLGSGLEIIDLAAAAEKGIMVINSPEGNANAVAEHTLGLLLSLTKNISRSQQEVRQGLWLREQNRGMELDGKTIGIIGFGHTGQAFARKLAGFEVNVLAYDVRRSSFYQTNVLQVDNLDYLFNSCHVLSFHVPLMESTRHYFNAAMLEEMGGPFYLLNTSRGEVLDVAALEAGLASGKILGAGLDVWEGEPLSTMNEAQKAMLARVSALPNVVVTPHIAGYSEEALYKMSNILLRKILVL